MGKTSLSKVAVIGGGPAGLYFALSLKTRAPHVSVSVFERNKPDDTFGWGVVLSEETLTNLDANDPISAAEIRKHFAYWDDIALHHQGQRLLSTGHAFCGIGRKRLLLILQSRAREQGADLHFETNLESIDQVMADHDVVVGADGLNSRSRAHFESTFTPNTELRLCQFVWLGTHQKFDDAFTFIFEETEHGWMWAHAYQFDNDLATFIVECSQDTYDNFGFADLSQQESIDPLRSGLR